jgi:hypothetical protein
MPSTAFGVGRAQGSQLATSTTTPTRFGTPDTERSDAYKAYGINASNRVGHPTGSRSTGRAVTGFTTVQFGAHGCRPSYPQAHIPPTAVFGTPLLIRTPAC